MPTDHPSSDAARVSAIRELLPTTLGHGEIRDEIAADVRARSVWVSRAGNAVFLSKVKEVVDAVADGKMDKASARVTILEVLRAIDYTPEGGFPTETPGTVPPAVAGTLQDLSSHQRLNLIVETQVALMNGRGQQLRGMNGPRMEQFPAYELLRVVSRSKTRNWHSRWMIAGGETRGGRMIALKGDAVWGQLGSSGNFDDALDTDHPPFAFNSGMGWAEIDRAECAALGITGPHGETIEQWQDEEHPIPTTMAPPAVDMEGIDPALAEAIASRQAEYAARQAKYAVRP